MRFAPFMLFQKTGNRQDSHRSIIQSEIDCLVEAEAMGYDGAYIAEHVFSNYCLSSSPAAIASAVASRTRTINIGVAVIVLPLQHPLRTAADWATLDVISDGRVELGVGRGYNWFEFDSLGIDLGENAERFQESLQVMRQAWTQERVTFHGKYFDVVETEVLPRPVQKPHPPLFYASSSSQSIEAMARAGLGCCPTHRPGPAELLKRRELWIDTASAAGFSEKEIGETLRRTPTQRWVWVAETDRQAREECRAMYQRFLDSQAAYAFPGHSYPGRTMPAGGPQSPVATPGAPRQDQAGAQVSYEEVEENYGILAGSPATVRTRLQELVDQVPIDYLLMGTSTGGPHPDDVRRSLRLFADKVMPHFK